MATTTPIDDGGTVTPAASAYKPTALYELVAVALDSTLPVSVRAAATVVISDHLEAARARDQRTFMVLGAVTTEPELLLAGLLFGAVPAALHVHGATRAARRAATN